MFKRHFLDVCRGRGGGIILTKMSAVIMRKRANKLRVFSNFIVANFTPKFICV